MSPFFLFLSRDVYKRLCKMPFALFSRDVYKRLCKMPFALFGVYFKADLSLDILIDLDRCAEGSDFLDGIFA